ncbi:MAG: hypothetical protein ACXVCO_09235, partial [Ktedonobacterales bacterium]
MIPVLGKIYAYDALVLFCDTIEIVRLRLDMPVPLCSSSPGERTETMTRTIEIGILTRNGPVRGFLYPVPHARDGIILIGSESDLFGPAAIFEELALYLQGAGFTLLQIGAPHPHSLSGYTYDILGALSALHTWDVERVALVLWSSYEPDNEPDAMLGGKKKISGADAVARVVDTIVGLVGVVVGVATIIGM